MRTSGMLAILAAFSASSFFTSAAASWPQYQHDPQRTGYSPEPLHPPMKEAWSARFGAERIAGTAQAVVHSKMVFIGTRNGVMRGLDLGTGRILWEFRAKGGITHTAAAMMSARVARVGRVFFGSTGEKVYCLEAATGKEQWRTGGFGGFSAPALLVEDLKSLYMVSRRGMVYCLDVESGGQKWTRDIGHPILQGPAFGADDRKGRIYFGAEDMRVRALDAGSGRTVWTSEKLHGMSFHDYCPVVAGDKVIVNVMPHTFPPGGKENPVLKEAHQDPKTPEELARSQERIVEWAEAFPAGRTFHVLDAATGRAPYAAGVLYSCVNSGAQPPPVYAEGNLYVIFSVISPQWLRHAWHKVDYSALGRLDLATGRVVERIPGRIGEMTCDETNNFSGCGGCLLGVRSGGTPGGMNLKTGVRVRVERRTRYPFTDDVCSPGNAPVFSDGMMLHHNFNVLTCFKGTGGAR